MKQVFANKSTADWISPSIHKQTYYFKIDILRNPKLLWENPTTMLPTTDSFYETFSGDSSLDECYWLDRKVVANL